MDYQIVSKKIIIAVVVFSLFCLCLSFIRMWFAGGQKVTVCSNGKQIVAVFQIKRQKTIVVPSNDLKSTLDCLRRGMDIFSRNIDLLITSHTSNTVINELRLRYHLKQERNEFTDISGYSIYASKHILLIDSHMLFGLSLKAITNPFTFVDFINNDHPEIIYIPEMDNSVKQMVQKKIENEVQIIELSEGEYISIPL